MVKKISLFLILLFAASCAFAQGDGTVTLKGTVIDNRCSAGKDPGQLAEFLKTHTKECVLACSTSGYAIFADGALTRFDKDSSAKVEEFLNNPGSKTEVIVEVKPAGKEFTLISIQNQK